MEKISILLADDHQLIRETWKFILDADPRFIVVGSVENGEQAIEIAQNTRPNVVLMDINMHEMSGFEATKQINKVSPGSKVIGVSMHSMPAYVKKMLSVGASGYVTKNSSQSELIKVILEVNEGKISICDEVKNIITNQELDSETPKQDINSLTKRELEIVQLIKKGMTSKEISGQLSVSTKTIEVHRYNILKKLKLSNSAALVNFINQLGI